MVTVVLEYEDYMGIFWRYYILWFGKVCVERPEASRTVRHHYGSPLDTRADRQLVSIEAKPGNFNHARSVSILPERSRGAKLVEIRE